jgi:hypothetical protein
MIKKQQKKIMIFAIAAVALILAYFLIISPIIQKAAAVAEAEIPNLLDGEVLGSQNRILMMEHVEKADIQQIEIHNNKGTYTIFKDKTDNFAVLNNEGAPISPYALSSLVVSAGYTLSMTRVSEDCDDLAEYGLADSDNPAWYKLTKTDGIEHTVYIGDAIPTGAGYYCRYQDRDAVYVLDASLSTTLLADVRDIITPILSYPISSTQYYTTNDFWLKRNGEMFVHIDYLTEEERAQFAAMENRVYVMKHPTSYEPSTGNYDTILQTFVEFVGFRTLEIGKTNEIMDEETLLKYGIDPAAPAYEIHYEFGGFDNFIFFSELNENGTYYAYSLLFNLIAEVDPAKVPFLNWDIIKFVDRPIFQRNINDIALVEIESPEVNETFTLEGEGQTILITPKSTGVTFDADGLQNFRQFYKVMLSLQLEDYTENRDTNDCMATMRVTTDSGIKIEYKFYPYSTRRAYFTINGVGEFYTQRDMVDKMLSDCAKSVQLIPIDSEGKS